MSYIYTKLDGEMQRQLNIILNQRKAFCLAGSIALALALADSIALPAQKITDISEYYRLEHKIPLDAAIGQVNEVIVVNFDEVHLYAKKFYERRYYAAFGVPYFNAIKPETAIVDLFQISKVFAPEEIKAIESNVAAISEMANFFRKLLQVINPPQFLKV